MGAISRCLERAPSCLAPTSPPPGAGRAARRRRHRPATMLPEHCPLARLALSLLLVVSSEALFFRWGSDTSRQAAVQKQWIPNVSPAYRYPYMYSPYESRKVYSMQPQPYSAEIGNMGMGGMGGVGPIPISVPAAASLTPVSLQHVQLVPCMCPVAPEEADKLHEQLGPGPYLAQAYSAPSNQQPPEQNKPAPKQ